MRCLPTIRYGGFTLCEDDGDFEGGCLQIIWLGLAFQMALVRRERRP